MKLNYQSKNQGLTLIEALIWFAIFAAVVAGVFALYSNSRNASNASTVNKELSTIFSQTEQLYATESTDGLVNADALKLGVFPKSVKVNGNTINNVFGGTIVINGVAPSGFTVAYSNVPSGEVCSAIVRSQKAVGWDSVSTGSKEVTYDSTYKISNVADACGSNGGKSVTVTFTRANSQT